MAFFTTIILALIVSFAQSQLCYDCYCTHERVACRNTFVTGVLTESLREGQVFFNLHGIDFKACDLEVLDLGKVLQLFPNAKSIDLRSGQNLDCQSIDLDHFALEVDIMANCPRTPSLSESTMSSPTTTTTTSTSSITTDDVDMTTEIQLYGSTTSTALISFKSSTAEESKGSQPPLSIVIPSVVAVLITLVSVIICCYCWCCRGGGGAHHQRPIGLHDIEGFRTTSQTHRLSSSTAFSELPLPFEPFDADYKTK